MYQQLKYHNSNTNHYMSTRLIIDEENVYKFLRSQGVDLPRSADQQGIGLERDGELVGGVMYEGFNGPNIWVHCAGVGRWITKDLLKAAFAYPFVQLGVSNVWGWVDASNQKARRLDEHLGFTQQAVLTGAAKDGGDVIIYRMTREECRFLQ
jgi:RimJ/RimL family protein N-acetyltransferase